AERGGTGGIKRRIERVVRIEAREAVARRAGDGRETSADDKFSVGLREQRGDGAVRIGEEVRIRRAVVAEEREVFRGDAADGAERAADEQRGVRRERGERAAEHERAVGRER